MGSRKVTCYLLSHVWLCEPMDYSPPSSSVHGILQAGIIGVGFHFLLQGLFLTMGSNLGLLHWRQTLYHLSHQGILGGIENRSKTELEVWLARSLSKMLFEEDGLSTKEWDGKHCLLLFWKKLRYGFLRYPHLVCWLVDAGFSSSF